MSRASDIQRQAADWVVRLHSDQSTAAEREQFKAWLEAEPDHATAYAEHAALFAGIGSLMGNDDLRSFLMAPRRRQISIDRRAVFLGAAGIAATVGGILIAPALAEKVIETKVGEQKHVHLADGSNLVVNTDSRIRVSMTHSERHVFIDRGQAYFDVAKDHNRPFRVFIGSDEVRAIGTAFDVERVGTSARVTLEEGKVAIYRYGSVSSALRPEALDTVLERPAAVLVPGQQVLLRDKTTTVSSAKLEMTRAWRYGQLVFDETPLGDTVDEFNRYGGPRIVLGDPSLASIKISGVFHTTDPRSFTESICQTFPVKVVSEDEATIVLGRRAM